MTRTWRFISGQISIGLLLVCVGVDTASGQEEAQEGGSPQPIPSDARASTNSFTLSVVGPEGHPVAEAEVEIRTVAKLNSEAIRVGTPMGKHRYGIKVKANAKGEIALDLPDKLFAFVVCIQMPGYGPYWAEWRGTGNAIELPKEHTAQLDLAWSIGGIVVDEGGNPLPGVEVHPNIKFKKRPGDGQDFYIGTNLKTDAEGKWRFDSVPASMTDVHLSFSHSSFQPLRDRFPRSGYELGPDEQPKGKFVLKEGPTVTGRVVDELGQPITNATIRTEFLNDMREARTDDNGNYRLSGCEPLMTRLVVSAPGRALELKAVRVEPDMEPVDFILKPGGTVRVRVVDAQGKGIANTRIFFQRWRGKIDYFEFDHVPDHTDENGIWEWKEAPLDGFEADICAPGKMQLSYQALKSRDEEYLFQPPEALVVSGRVRDAVTGQAIPKVTVLPGSINPNPQIGIDWHEGKRHTVGGGAYNVRLADGMAEYVVKIEAPGYRAKVSRRFGMKEGNVTFDFNLEAAQDISAAIVDAEGNPAANAKIAIGTAKSQISIDNGDIDFGSTYATEITADGEGRFSLPAQQEDFILVVTHPAGFAYLNSAVSSIPAQLILSPWARVEGTFHIAGEPASNIRLEQDTWRHLPWSNDRVRIFASNRTTSGEHGEFAFERVYPGSGAIGREITLMVDDGATEVTSAVRMPVTTASGETLTIDLGKTGRRIVGQLLPPEGHKGKVHWNFIVLHGSLQVVYPPRDDPPADLQNDEAKVKAWRAEWAKSPRGVAWRLAYEATRQRDESSAHLRATVDQDGRFTIDDVPPGNYVLSSRFSLDQAPGQLEKMVVEVPADGDTNDPIDLGQIRLTR